MIIALNEYMVSRNNKSEGSYERAFGDSRILLGF